MARSPVSKKLAGEKVVLDLGVMHRIGVPAALMLRTLSYWSQKAEDGWGFRTRDEIQQATTLTFYQQQQARKVLEELGLLKEERRGVPARMYYRIDFAALDEFLSDPTDWMPKIDPPVEENSSTGAAKFVDKPIVDSSTIYSDISEGSTEGLLLKETLPPVAPVTPDPATMFLDPAEPLTPPTPSLPEAPAAEEPAFTEDEQGLALPPPGVMPRALSRQEKQVIGRRAHILASGYYKAIGEKPPRAGIASADARRAFEHLALDYDGYVDATDVEGCTRWLMTDPFWKPGSSLTPAAVGKRVIQWIDQDRPTHAKLISRRQQQTAAFADDLKSNRDQARDLIRQRMGIDPKPVDIEPANTFEASYVVNE